MIEQVQLERKKGGSIVWEESHMNKIKELYESGMNLTQVGKVFGVSYGTIKNKLKEMGVKILGHKDMNPRNSNYFNPQNLNEESAYWLGFLYADGCVHTKSNEISISLKDEEHLYKFKEAISSSNHIGVTNVDKFKKPTKVFHFSIRDKQLRNDLVELGCVPQKSLKLEKIPNIKEELIPHFIRGYFDGDGSLHYTHDGKRVRISFLGTKSFLENIREILDTNNSISLGTGKAYYFQVAGQEKVYKILEYLYKDSTEKTRLNRKYELYQNMLRVLHS